MYATVNVLIRRFSYCSTQVKLILFKSYCLCYYDVVLWENYHVSAVNKLASAYVKCLKLFFAQYSSVSAMLIQLNLPSFITVLYNARVRFYSRLCQSYGAVMHAVIQLGRTNTSFFLLFPFLSCMCECVCVRVCSIFYCKRPSCLI